MPSRLLRRTVTAAALAAPAGWVDPRRLGPADRAGRAPPPAAAGRDRLVAVLRRQVPQHARDPGPPPGEHPRRAAAAVARGAARRPARARPSRWSAPSSRPRPRTSPSPGSATPARCSRSTAGGCWSTRSGASGSRRRRCSGRPGCTRAADRRWRSCRRSTPSSSRTTTTTTSTCRRCAVLLTTPVGAVRRPARASASTCASGACPRTASSSWTGTAAPPSPGSRSPAPRPGTSPAGTSTATPRCGRRGRSRARSTGSSSAATPATRPPSPRSARGSAPSTSRCSRSAPTTTPGTTSTWTRRRRCAPTATCGGRVLPADPLGHVQPGLPPLGRAGAARAGRGEASPTRRSSSPGPVSGSTCWTCPAQTDWWTAIGSADDHPDHPRDAGVGSAVLARTISRLLALLPD